MPKRITPADTTPIRVVIVTMDGHLSRAASRAQALNGRGAEKVEAGDCQAAIADFDAALAVPDVPAEYRLITLYNRAEAKATRGDGQGQIAD